MRIDNSVIILSIAYLPPVEYIRAIKNSGKVGIEQHENFQKQSYRNRCQIYSADGLLSLRIPVIRDRGHLTPIRDIKIDNSKRWQHQHWMAIKSAYMNSPFFEYYQDDFAPFYNSEYNYLFDFNFELTQLILNLMEVEADIFHTDGYVANYGDTGGDLRDEIHPKRISTNESLKNKSGQYFQVFAHKFGFIDNLSSVDLLFNEGPNSFSYL